MTEPFDRILKQTLDDYRLSRGEKRVLAQIIHELAVDERGRALLRSRAFEVAREALASPAEPAARSAVGVLDWLEEVNKLLLPTTDLRPEADDRAEAYFTPRDDIPHRIVRMVDRAAKYLDVCVFTITDNRIADALIRAAQRGLAVRIVTDNDKSADLGSDIQRMGQAGMAVRVDRSESHMHHKFALFDRQTLLTGSYNWTRSAADENQENVVVSRDPQLARTFQQEFDRLWEQWK